MKLSRKILTNLIRKELKRSLLQERNPPGEAWTGPFGDYYDRIKRERQAAQQAELDANAGWGEGGFGEEDIEIEKVHPEKFGKTKENQVGYDVLDLDHIMDFRTAFATARGKKDTSREGERVYKYFTFGGNTEPWPGNVRSTLQATEADRYMAKADRVMPEEDIVGRTNAALEVATAEFDGRDIGAPVMRPPDSDNPYAGPSAGPAGKDGRSQFNINDEALFGPGAGPCR